MFVCGEVAGIEGLDAGMIAQLSDDDLEATARDLARVRQALDAVWLRVLDAVRDRGLYLRHGARDTATWVAGLTGERRGVTRRDVQLAEMVATTPVVAAALSAGEVSKAQAAELVRAGDLPVEVQADLVEQAARIPVEQLAGEVLRARLDHGAPVAEVVESVTTARTETGFRAEVHLDREGGDYFDLALRRALDRLGLAKELAIEQRRAWALKHVCRFFVDHVDDETPAQTRTGPGQMMTLVGFEVIEARTGGSARLASGAVITGDTARRLACDAGITRIITNGRSEILDVGRSTRTISPALAKAVIARDQHCQHPSCDAPPWACEIHHIHHWAHGRPTNLTNLQMLCWHHHQHTHTDARARAPNDEAAA